MAMTTVNSFKHDVGDGALAGSTDKQLPHFTALFVNGDGSVQVAGKLMSTVMIVTSAMLVVRTIVWIISIHSKVHGRA